MSRDIKKKIIKSLQLKTGQNKKNTPVCSCQLLHLLKTIMKDIFLKLIDAIFGVAVGACKGLKYLMTAFPFILLGFVVLLVFFHEQTVAALDTIKLLIG